MINYDEELKKYQPSLDVEQAEDAIKNNDIEDVTDMIKKFMNEMQEAR